MCCPGVSLRAPGCLTGEGRARERLYLLDEFDHIREYFGDV